MLVAIRRDGTGAQPLNVQDNDAIVIWWSGNGNAAIESRVTAIICTLHDNKLWLSCGCLGTGLSHTDRPIIVPAKTGETLYLKRISQRAAHSSSCTFWSDQAFADGNGHDDSRVVFDSSKIPKFLLKDNSNASASETKPNVNPTQKSRSNADTPGTLAGRLFWLANKAGWQDSPNSVHPIASLADFASKFEVESLKLNDILFCTVRGITEGWYESKFKKCIQAGHPPQCWWVQLIEEYDTQTRIIRYRQNHGPDLTLPVHGSMHVFGGDARKLRFPMIAICLVRPDTNGAKIQSAYAHPVRSTTKWTLVDSDLERYTLRDIAQICNAFSSPRGVQVTLHKPLSNWNGTSERPDFVLAMASSKKIRHLVIETMGFDDVEYLSRKSELSKNVGGDVFLDYRNQIRSAVNTQLQYAVSAWLNSW